MLTAIKTFESFDEILAYCDKLAEEDQEALRQTLEEKWKNTIVASEVDIVTDAQLWFLLALDTLESLGRSNKKSCNIALNCLQRIYQVNEYFLNKLGVTLCNPYLHENNKSVPCMSYDMLGKHLADFTAHYKITNSRKPPVYGIWQTIYLLIMAIYHKEERQLDTWVQSAKNFYSNSELEFGLNDNIPGLSFYNRGVRHDMLCPVAGTSDPDFLYKNTEGQHFVAEFKKPTITVESLANYAFKHPEYIYNAKFLFTYGKTNNGAYGFYKIDYTKVPYVIEQISTSDTLIQVIQRG